MSTPHISPSSPAPGASLRSGLLVLGGALALALALLLARAGGPPPLELPSLSTPGTPAAPIVPNHGQSDPRVRFEARATGGAIFFTRREVVLGRDTGTLRLRFDGAARAPAVRAVDRRPGVVNSLRGGSDRWRTGLPTYAAVVYGGLYPGVDLRLDSELRAGGPWARATYTVAPGADPEQVRWRYGGAASSTVDPATGGLVVLPRIGAQPVRESAPIAWQEIGGARVPVPTSYRLDGDGALGFSVGRYDRGRPLMLAALPAAQVAQGGAAGFGYSTFLGGTQWDEATKVTADAAGNAYVTGFTQSIDFPRVNARIGRFRGVEDAFVTRLDRNGRLVYSTYLGGTKTDAAHGIAVDDAGNAYVTGRTESPNFPVVHAAQPALNGLGCTGSPCHDAFVAKLNRSGALVYSTFLGGTGNEEGVSIAVDADGAAYVTGNTDSEDLPTRNALQDDNRSRPCDGDVPCPFDGFVAKLTPAGTDIVYSTYLGGRTGELAGGIAVDDAGSAYVTGTTDSTDFPLRTPLQGAIRGRACGPPPGVPCEDAYVTKLSPAGDALVWSTLLGGTQPERGSGIAVDSEGRAHVVGSTRSNDFPLARPFQATIGNGSCRTAPPVQELCDDGFVTVLAADGRSLRFSSFIGGNAEDQALAVAVAATGNVFVGGSTDSRAFRTRNALQPALAGAIDAFLIELAPGGQLLRSTYLGGKENERIKGVAVDEQGGVIVGGRTDSPDFPTARAVRPRLRGDIDAFVARLTR